MHEIYPPPYNPSKRDTVNTDYDRCVACVGVGELLWPDRYRVGAHKIVNLEIKVWGVVCILYCPRTIQT